MFTVDSTLSRLRTMPGSASSRSTSRFPKRATLLRVEVRERLPIPLALAQDRQPREPGLRALERQHLEQVRARRATGRPTPRRGRRRTPGSPREPTRSASCLRDLGLSAAAVGADLDCQHLVLDPVLVLQQVGRRSCGSVTTIRSVSSSPASLRMVFSSWIRSRTRPLELELGVERRVERDREPVAVRDRPALAPDALDEHLVRPRGRGPRRGSRRSSCSNSPASSAARTAPSSLPSFGPSTGRFGFTRSSVASTWPNSTSFTRSSSRSRRHAPAPSCAPCTTSRRSGWRSLQPRRARA